MSPLQHQLEAGIRAIEAQRALLGDAVVDMAVATLKAKLAALDAPEEPLAEPAQTLKQVSILFLDVVGSTALAQHLDPEAVGAVMDDVLARGTAVVQEWGGKVLQYAGDNILAAFGTDGAREDDAERAVHCGLALLEVGKRIGAEVQAFHGQSGFDVRVGIHTGGVLLGGGVDADGSIRGIAVNIAARMEQTAPAGALRISQDTFVQVRGIFILQPQEPIVVKGVDQPMLSYLVLRPKPRTFRTFTRGIDGSETRMVGRGVEFLALQSAFSRLLARRRFDAVIVSGEAGLGKSRLLHEFQSWAEDRSERYLLFRGRAAPQMQGQPFGLLRDIVTLWLQINDDDTLVAARTKIEQGLMPLFAGDEPDLAEGHSHVLGHLIGLEWADSRHVRAIAGDPRQVRSRGLRVAAQMFRRAATLQDLPVVLQIEDLHWADDESLDFLASMAEVNADVPMLVLGFTRPTLFERRQLWGASYLRVELQALNHRDSRNLVEQLLRKLPGIPATLRELIVGRAEGNPFYMEELVRMLIDQGAIRTGPAWHVDAKRLIETKVPPTLTGVLQARLDSLPTAEKRTLQQASVIGAVFWDRALVALDARAEEPLQRLVQRELTLPRDHTALEGLREYAFRHHILHQVTYATVLRRTRAELHGRIAIWLAALAAGGGVHGGDLLGLVAHHYEQAGDPAHAAEYHGRAAEQAAARHAHASVLDHVAHAIALLESLPATETAHSLLRWRLIDARERTLELQGARDRQAADLDTLEELAEALDDDTKRTLVMLRRCARAMRSSDWTACQQHAQRAVQVAQAAGLDDLRLQSQRISGHVLVCQGEIEAGKMVLLQALAESQALDHKAAISQCLNSLAIAAELQGDRVAMNEMNRQALKISRDAGDRRTEAITLGNLGASWLQLGDLESARRDLEESLRLKRADGNRGQECGSLTNLSILALRQGDPERALALARDAQAIAVAVQARSREVNACCALGDAALALGLHNEAASSYEAARRIALAIGDPTQYDAAAGLARVALARRDLSAAMEEVEALLQHAAVEGNFNRTDNPRRIELTCCQVLTLACDARAERLLRQSYAALQSQASAISDGQMREWFLTRITEHREIVVLWRQHQSS